MDRAGQGKGQNLRGGAGGGGARGKISGPGQNVSISADLDHLLKEGEPRFEHNSIYDLHFINHHYNHHHL